VTGAASVAVVALAFAGCTGGGGGGAVPPPVGPGGGGDHAGDGMDHGGDGMDHGGDAEGGAGGGQSNGWQKGPTPTDASISATRGPFAISQVRVNRANGYGGGTIYFPTQAGTYAGIVVVPGFMSYESSIQWYGPRLASQGFVVHTIDTNTVTDQPSQRGRQLDSALRTITTDSRVAAKVDKNRLGLMGWSMGGGGTFESALRQPNVKAIMPLAPWNMNTNFRNLRTPTLIVSCSADTIAPNVQHSIPLYNNVGATEKANFTINGSHFCVTMPTVQVGKMAVAWMKRWLDNDTRYSQLVCAGPGAGATGWKNTCPV
jgi:hypothetical protein